MRSPGRDAGAGSNGIKLCAFPDGAGKRIEAGRGVLGQRWRAETLSVNSEHCLMVATADAAQDGGASGRGRHTRGTSVLRKRCD